MQKIAVCLEVELKTFLEFINPMKLANSGKEIVKNIFLIILQKINFVRKELSWFEIVIAFFFFLMLLPFLVDL